LEDAIYDFSKGKGNVLVCTTIIENGIDIPNANTLIVCDADKLGLSQLYQLRGRVGRSNRLAYAYFLYRKDKILNETAYKRLSSITEYSELGSGFKIAMKDLEIRGAGNILGREQHGHMMKVGYDMYARLLKETVAELKGEKVEEKINTDVEVDIEAYAPDDYIAAQTERMDFYQNLAACETLDAIKNLQNQLQEVYGTMPRQVENLFAVATLKLLATKASVIRVSVKPGRGEMVFATKESMMNKKVFDALSECGDRASASATGYSIVFSSTDYLQKNRLMQAMQEFLLKIQP
jgi:transcription-repair coupling factor (superfamily II helicase)